MLDVLVTCRPHAERPSYFPQVRGHFLAKHLARSGLQAEFRQLPAPDAECRVVICSEYQCDLDWFESRFAAPLSEIRADRWFCLTAYSIGDQDHFSRGYLDWFAARGGILCHQEEQPLGAAEHLIGLGVDIEALDDLDATPRDSVVFDFAGLVRRPDAVFDPALLDAVRDAQPDARVIGTGPAGAAVSALFDDWVHYGQPHPEYIRALLPRAFAFVSGLLGHGESMGLAVAEAQSAGVSSVHGRGSMKKPMLCPEASIEYECDDAGSLAAAVVAARARDPAIIRDQARERFGYAEVVRRTRAAIGL